MTSLLFSTPPSGEEIEPVKDEKADWVHVESTNVDEDEKMDVDEVEDVGGPITTEVEPVVWGMPRWGWEDERKEVRKGARLVGMEEVSFSAETMRNEMEKINMFQLPGLIDQHAMIDTPSHVLFPWLHGISDDGAKGRDMAAFFG